MLCRFTYQLSTHTDGLQEQTYESCRLGPFAVRADLGNLAQIMGPTLWTDNAKQSRAEQEQEQTKTFMIFQYSIPKEWINFFDYHLRVDIPNESIYYSVPSTL